MLKTSDIQTMTKILRDMKNPPVEEATTGDKEEYQRKRKEIAKKFGVESCSALKDEKERKACYAALDASHVSDDEEDEDDDPVGKNEEVKEAVLVDRDYKYDGKVIKISKKNFSKVHRDFKNPTKGKEMMMTYDNKVGTVLVPVEFTEEVEIEEQQIDEKETAYPPTIENLKKIVKDKQNQIFMFKDGRARVDLFSASAMTQVYDAMKKPELKKNFEKMLGTKAGFLKIQAFAFSMVK
jgi:hypothetical protein